MSRSSKPRPEADIRRDLAEQLEAVVRGFEEQVARDADEDAEAARYVTNWPVS